MTDMLDMDIIVSEVQQAGCQAVSDVDPARVVEAANSLYTAAFVSMVAGFRDQGLFQSPHQSHSAQSVLAALPVNPRHRWLVRRWLDLLAAAGWLVKSSASDQYVLKRSIVDDSVEVAWRLVEQYGREGLWLPAFVDYHRKHADSLPALLAGELNAIELLFPEGRHIFANAIYRDDALSRYNNHVIAALVEHFVTRHCEERPLKLLELGAGTGATTEAVVPVLDGRDVDYLFTDMTRFFLNDARNRFRDFSWIRFGILDLNVDPNSQGVTSNTADIVLCAGMLSSTADVAVSIDRVVDILKPGGWLVLSEPVTEIPYILLAQGFMMDPAGGDREHGHTKFLSVEKWRALIEARGGEIVLCLPGEDDPFAAFGMRVLAARFKTGQREMSSQSQNGSGDTPSSLSSRDSGP